MALSTLPRITTDMVGARFLQYADKAAVELPANGVTELTDAELADLETAARTAFDAIAGSENPTDEDVAEAERLAGIVTAVKAEAGTRTQAIEGRRTALESLSEKVAPAAAPVEAPVEAPAAVEVPAEEPELIAASAAGATPARVRAAEVGSRQAKPAAPRREPMSLTAAPDAPGRALGSAFANVDEVAASILKRTGEYPSRPVPGSRVSMRHGIAMLHRPAEEGLTAASVNDDSVLAYATDQSRLPGGSLIAAGGWCAPSETLYDLAELEAADGLVNLPEITAQRGGIRFTPGPDFRTIFDGTGFQQTEVQAIGGATKPTYKVPCPDFQEERADAIGLIISAGILQNKAYPELTARVVRGALAAHAHRVSAATISKMVADSTAVATLTATAGAATPVLNAIELAVEDIKYRHRMARTAVLEAVFPAWTFALIRADLAGRMGLDSFLAVTDEQIAGWFRQRNIAAQFVYDWQDSALGAATAAAALPSSIQFLVYPAGTFVRGHGEVLTLDTVYDSAGLAQNEYVGLFTEESLLVAKLGHESRLYTVPVVADGSLAAVVHTKALA